MGVVIVNVLGVLCCVSQCAELCDVQFARAVAVCSACTRVKCVKLFSFFLNAN